ncbi:MAG: DUF4330 family protein [Candidatus Woesearchaeota archaeon]|jgi:hypothetical protein
MKLIDSKGRIFNKINIIDLIIIFLFILCIIALVKFTFFKQDYLTHKDFYIKVHFENVLLEDINKFSYGIKYLDLNNESYLDAPNSSIFNCSMLRGKILGFDDKNNSSVNENETYICEATVFLKVHTLLIDDIYYYNSFPITLKADFTIDDQNIKLGYGKILEIYDGNITVD